MDRFLRDIVGGYIFANTDAKRSKNMSAIRGKGNRTTEQKLRMALVRSGLNGWVLHRRDLPGRPDFVFQKENLAVFVDGCFWHFCARCGHIPKSRSEYWQKKFELNKARDLRNVRRLRGQGYKVVRIWEHELASVSGVEKAVNRIRRMLTN
jgi:DNA mismatch endonuclease (patch repair protein)